jgi:STE24 endopeptidase
MARFLLVVLLIAGLAGAAPLAPNVPPEAQPSLHFDVDSATHAWLRGVPAAAKARSDAYFEGGYWLILWDFLWLAGIMILLLVTRLSARMRDNSTRLVRWPWAQRWLYWVQFAAVAAILELPLTIYEGFWRERQYSLMNQSFPGWVKDGLIEFALVLILGGAAFTLLMGLVRWLPRTWHLWGIVAWVGMAVFAIAIAPVFIAPLFNAYKPLGNQVIKAKILSMAHANDIPVRDVFEVNASKQSNRVSAFVTGIAGTDRIVLNDNLLKRVSPEGIMAVMGHEMGHYVMHHIFTGVLFLAISAAIMFLLLRWALERGTARWGERWGIRDIADPAVLPLAVLVLAIFNFVTTPVGNTFVRTQEYAADLYGLNAARQPDGEAEVDLLLGEYRKLEPGPIEEFLFFDHPSGLTRIRAAMRWKSENLCLFDARLPCQNRPAR